MVEAIKAVYGNYAGFSGRAARPEYWWFTLFFLIVYLGGLMMASATESPLIQLLVLGFVLGSLVPSIAVTVRRLHDTGRSGWWYLIVLIPIIGPFVLLFFALQPSDAGPNQYGPPPGGGPHPGAAQEPHPGPFTG